MMLWGSAAPVVLLFLAALMVGNKSSRAKPPEELIVPDRAKQTANAAAKTELAHRTGDTASVPAAEVKPEEPKPDAAANAEKSSEEKAKEKAKDKKKKGPRKPKKDETTVAKTDDTPKTDEGARNGEPKPNSDSSTSTAASTSREKPEPASTSTPAPTTAANNEEPKDNTTSAALAPSQAPKKSLFKKKKPPVFSYPKREGMEKKAEPGPGAGPGTR